MNFFNGILLPALPPLPSIFNSSEEVINNGNSSECTSSSSTNTAISKGFESFNFSNFIESKSKSKSESDFDLDHNSDHDEFSIQDFETYNDYKMYKVNKKGTRLQKLISDEYCKGKELDFNQKINFREVCIEFVKMFLNDYCPDMYNHIVAILLDCKAMAKDFGHNDEKELIQRGLKMIQTKALAQGLPASGAGGPDYWTGGE